MVETNPEAVRFIATLRVGTAIDREVPFVVRVAADASACIGAY